MKKTNRSKADVSRRQFSFAYYFHQECIPVRVCKRFFSTTLDISQRRIYYFYDNFQTATNTPTARKQGKHVKKRISNVVRHEIRAHIKSIPCIDSHYCRANTIKQFLESALSISRLYEVNFDFCNEKSLEVAK